MFSEVFASLAKEWALLMREGTLIYLGVSFLCGALVGLEREAAHKPAGLRTNIMICVGSCLFTLASIYSWRYITHETPSIDPGRIAAQIVSGVGFIGAGVILRMGLQVTGITTAATVWLTASIGMVVGMGFPLLGLIVSVLATLTLFALGRIEINLPKKPE